MRLPEFFYGINVTVALSVTVTYGDGTTEIVDVGFKEVGGGDNSGKVSDKAAVYVK